jgi:hypothetical protein
MTTKLRYIPQYPEDVTLEGIRLIVREEIRACLELVRNEIESDANRGLDNLMADISEPVDEQEEMAAVLASMTPSEWETLVQRVKARKATE